MLIIYQVIKWDVHLLEHDYSLGLKSLAIGIGNGRRFNVNINKHHGTNKQPNHILYIGDINPSSISNTRNGTHL